TNDGGLVRKTYTFDSYRIRIVKREAYNPHPDVEAPKPVATVPAPPAMNGQSPYAKMMDRVKRLFH
ncbi:MAG TPA: hypothetical protein VH157_04670, partial [Bryobacteraceae bacterium]|nr:hypothetical protein [Bryobacteraceae bacterium]